MFMHEDQLIRMGTYYGKIKRIFMRPDGGTIIQVYFVKNAFQRNMPEYQEIDDTHDIVEATPEEIKAEIGRYMRMLRESLQEEFSDVMG